MFNLTTRRYSLEGCVRCAHRIPVVLTRLENGAQWADEVINAKDKTTLTGEAKELEQEIELRKEGLQRCAYWIYFPRTRPYILCHGLVAASPRLQLAAEQYHKSISKKRVSHALDDPDKFLPREALGTTMVRHGEDFAEDSLLGNHGIIRPVCPFLAQRCLRQDRCL